MLAISGGLDSMVLLDAAASDCDARRVLVATFDHASGPASRSACEAVRQAARDRRLECVAGRAPRGLIRRSEASWREARWNFLRDVARAHGASVATAHTADDQIETVLMRALRDAGPRGMAGLLAATHVLRPLLDFRRAELLGYAAEQSIEWVEDPTNASRRYLRNRLRHDILPAFRRVNSRIDAEFLELGRRAGAWRRETEAVANVVSNADVSRRVVDVGVAAIRDLDAEQLAVVWPAVAARIGVTLDRRGIRRVSGFSTGSRVGSKIQLSGGWEVVRSRHVLRLRCSMEPRWMDEAQLAVSRTTTWGRWTFWTSEAASVSSSAPRQSEWDAVLPVDQPLRVRQWQPGDRWIGASSGTGRKVKRLLNDAGVTGHERRGWPVVLSGDRIVWIPGVRRSDAATTRPGGPILRFSCARHGS